MKVTVYGSGYVGLVVAACLAEVGNEVICMDVNVEKITQLQQGKIPIYEPGLAQIIQAALKAKTLYFTTNTPLAVKHGECQFIAVGTPADSEGKAELHFVEAVARAIATHMTEYTIIINKSTVPIGTADFVKAQIKECLIKRQLEVDFDVVSNPEFLKEGAAIEDFRHPHRVVIGIETNRPLTKLKRLYTPFCADLSRLMVMDVRSAELTKYAANCMLATKISFMNEMANLAEKVGADIEKVRLGIASDPRIGPHFTFAGCGYGGSCFGKDIRALLHTALQNDSHLKIIHAVDEVNKKQKLRIVEKILTHYQQNIKGKIFALWGLTFKPETDDIREAPSLIIIDELIKAGARIQAYDPKGMVAAKQIGNFTSICYGESPEEVLEGANALITLTEWQIFKHPDFNKIKEKLIDSVIFDGRNIFDPISLEKMEFIYYGIGRGKAQ